MKKTKEVKFLKKWNELRDYLIYELVNEVHNGAVENMINEVIKKMDDLDKKYHEEAEELERSGLKIRQLATEEIEKQQKELNEANELIKLLSHFVPKNQKGD